MLMLMRVMALRDPLLRDIRAGKRKLRWPEDAREEEMLEHKKAAHIRDIHDGADLAFAEARSEPSIVVRTFF